MNPYTLAGQRDTTNANDGIFNERQADGTVAGEHMLLNLKPVAKTAGYSANFTVVLTEENLHAGRGGRRGGPPPGGGRFGGPPPDGFGGPPPGGGQGGLGGPPPDGQLLNQAVQGKITQQSSHKDTKPQSGQNVPTTQGTSLSSCLCVR